MMQLHKFNLKKFSYFLIATAFSIAITRNCEAHNISAFEIYSTLTTDTIPKIKKDSLTVLPDSNRTQVNDTIPAGDSLKQLQNDTVIHSVDTFHLKLSKDTLDAPVDTRLRTVVCCW